MTEVLSREYEYVVGGEMPLSEEESAFWLNDEDGAAAHSVSGLLTECEIDRPALWLRFGRSALGLALRMISPEAPPKLAIPEYQCAEVIDKLEATTSTLVPYVLEEDLRPNTESLIHAGQECAALMTCAYFGSRNIDSSLDEIFASLSSLSNQPWVIEDRVTAFPNPKTMSEFLARCDFCVLSLRKTYPVPDGALLIACSDRAAEALNNYSIHASLSDERDQDGDIVRSKIAAKLIRGKWLKKPSLNDDRDENGLRASIDAEARIDLSTRNKDLDGITGSEGSLKYLAQRNLSSDFAVILKHRSRLLTCLEDLKFEQPICSDACGIALPVRLPRRDEFRALMADRGAFLPVHWPAHGSIELSPVTSKWHQHQLSLPTLPTWTDRDVEHLCDCLVSVASELNYKSPRFLND